MWPRFISEAWDNAFDKMTPFCRGCAARDLGKLKQFSGDYYSSGTLREAVAISVVNATMAEITQLTNADPGRAISGDTKLFRNAIEKLLPPHGPLRKAIELQLAPFYKAVYTRETIRKYFLVCDDGHVDRLENEDGTTTNLDEIAATVSRWADALTVFPTAKAIMLLSREGRNVLLPAPPLGGDLAQTRLSAFFEAMMTTEMHRHCNMRGANIAMGELASISHAFQSAKDKWVIQLVLRRLVVSMCVTICDDKRIHALTEQRRLISWTHLLRRKIASGSIIHYKPTSPSKDGTSFDTARLDQYAGRHDTQRGQQQQGANRHGGCDTQ